VRVVSCRSGARPLTARVVVFRRHASVRLLSVTASFASELGYVIPPGQWVFDAVIDLGDEGRYVTPHLPITVLP